MIKAPELIVRTTRIEDYDEIAKISRLLYRQDFWTRQEIASHLQVFPEGQLVAVQASGGAVVGMAAGLIVSWDDYSRRDAWEDFTDEGMFTNHDPENGRTFYGAEVMVHPDMQGQGIGSALYVAREKLVKRLGLLRIRCGSRLLGFHRHSDEMSPAEYVTRVVKGDLHDPVLSFQIRRGFRVIDVVPGYLPDDPHSLGYAALIELLNQDVATAEEQKRAVASYGLFHPE